MVASLRIWSQGQRHIEARMAALVHAFGDLEPLMTGFGVYLESATIDRFDRETDPDGVKWTPSKRAERDGGKTLTDSAQLRSSITSNAGSRSVEVGTNKIYAGVHNDGFDGTVSVSGHTRTVHSAFGKALPGGLTYAVDAFERHMVMPKRTFIGLSSEDESELLAQTADYSRAAMGNA